MKKNTLAVDLKKFFTHVIDVYGDDVAYAMATWKKSITEAINYFSKNKFEKKTDVDIYKELIRNEVLCEDNENDLVPLVKNMVAGNDIGAICDCIEFSDGFKETLIKAYMRHAHIPYESMIKKCEDQDNIYSYLETIDHYGVKKASARTKKLGSEQKD